MKRHIFQFSILATLTLVTVVAIAIRIWLSLLPMDHFEIVVSGDVVLRLEPNTQIVLWRNGKVRTKPTICAIEDLPLRMPRDEFLGQSCRICFHSPTSNELLFSVQLDSSLFDRPRRVNVKLDAPNPELKPFALGWRNFRYTANITQRMRYYDLPQLDSSTGKLSPLTTTPLFRVQNLTSGQTLHESRMGNGCMGSRWFERLDQEIIPDDKDRLRFSANYDSGGLFKPIETTFDFQYSSALHNY